MSNKERFTIISNELIRDRLASQAYQDTIIFHFDSMIGANEKDRAFHLDCISSLRDENEALEDDLWWEQVGNSCAVRTYRDPFDIEEFERVNAQELATLSQEQALKLMQDEMELEDSYWHLIDMNEIFDEWEKETLVES